MEKVKNIGIVVLIILLILIASLEGFYIVKSKDTCKNTNETTTIYKGHEFLIENLDKKLQNIYN